MKQRILNALRHWIVSAAIKHSPPEPAERSLPQPKIREVDELEPLDHWLFDQGRAMDACQKALAHQLDMATLSLSRLNDLLSYISADMPLIESLSAPVQNALMDDDVLFEVAAQGPDIPSLPVHGEHSDLFDEALEDYPTLPAFVHDDVSRRPAL